MKYFLAMTITTILIATTAVAAKPWNLIPGAHKADAVVSLAQAKKKGKAWWPGKGQGKGKGKGKAKGPKRLQACFERCTRKAMADGRPPNACAKRCQ